MDQVRHLTSHLFFYLKTYALNLHRKLQNSLYNYHTISYPIYISIDFTPACKGFVRMSRELDQVHNLSAIHFSQASISILSEHKRCASLCMDQIHMLNFHVKLKKSDTLSIF